jgi:hypothetical protein
MDRRAGKHRTLSPIVQLFIEAARAKASLLQEEISKQAVMDEEAPLRPELAQRLGLSFMAVSQIVRELADAGLVREGARDARSEPGPPATSVVIEPSGAYVLGFKLHALDQSMALMDLTRRLSDAEASD